MRPAFENRTLRNLGTEVLSHYYEAPDAKAGVVWVGGIVGGFDSPARQLYPDLANRLVSQGVSSLRIRLRWPGWVPSSVADVRTGIRFLRRQGIEDIGLVGHSIGSAVVLQAAHAERRSVRAVVSLSSLSLGVKHLDALSPTCACLFIHGERDAILPARFSANLYARAADPKRLRILPQAGHRLSEARPIVRREILSWLDKHLTSEVGS